MIKKIIFFGDHAGKDFDDMWNLDYIFLKSSALLRLTYAMRQEGFEVKQVHHCTSFNNEELEHILNDFSQGQPVLICISSSFITSVNRLDYAFHAEETKRTIPDLGDFWGKRTFNFLMTLGTLAKKYKFPVIMGGFDIRDYKFIDPKDIRAWGLDALNLFIDYYVMGPNPAVIGEFCRTGYLPHKTIKGKIRDSKIVITEPVKDYSDFGFKTDIGDNISPNEALISQIADGCIFSCSFCTYSALGKRPHEYCRTYESVKNEIVSNYENFGVRVYMFVDHMINDYPEKLKYLIRIREETGIDVRWGAYARLDTIKTREQAQMFKDAGCAGVIFGIESMKKEVGPYIGKMTDGEKIKDLLYNFRDVLGDTALTSGSYIAGAPTETKEELKQTYEWLLSAEGKNLLDHFIFTPLFIEPGINDRTEINQARNDPFRDYVLAEGKEKYWGTGWTSPWGKYEDYLELAIKYSDFNNKSITPEEAMSAMRGIFAIPIMHNLLPGGVDQYIADMRARKSINYDNRELFKTKNRQLIENYKKMTLGNSYGLFSKNNTVEHPLSLMKKLMKSQDLK